jgi:hypothetical protein
MPTAAAAIIPSTVAAQMSRRQQGERCFLVTPVVASDGCGGTVKLGMTRSSGLYALSVDCVGAVMVMLVVQWDVSDRVLIVTTYRMDEKSESQPNGQPVSASQVV